MENNVVLINPDFISDKFRTEVVTLKQLIERKQRGAISCNHKRQRATCSWTNDQIYKMLSWVCNGMPLPQIYICEEVENGIKRSYIIDGNHRIKNLELFITDQIVVRENGAERYLITYKDYITDGNGNKIMDEYDTAKFELKQFDIIGKPFSEFPEDLKDRIYGYNIGVTTFLKCTDDDVAYYMRNYNNHTQMNSVQKKMTEFNGDFVTTLNVLGKHDFFTDKTGMSLKTLNGNAKFRICIETLIASYFMNDWGSFNSNCDFIQDNVTDYQVATLERELDRLYEVVGEEDKKLFKANNSFLYLTLFHRFTKYDVDDKWFIEFLHKFNDELHSKEINGDCYDDVLKLGGSKQKSHVERKLRIMTDLMEDFLGVNEDYDEDSDEVDNSIGENNINKTSLEEKQDVDDCVEKYANYLFDSSYYSEISEGNTSYNLCHDLACDVIKFNDCYDEDILEYYTDSLYDYLDDMSITEDFSIEENGGFISVENTPALIGMIKNFEDDFSELDKIQKWFVECGKNYSNNESNFIGKDDKYRFNFFMNVWKNVNETENNKVVA